MEPITTEVRGLHVYEKKTGVCGIDYYLYLYTCKECSLGMQGMFLGMIDDDCRRKIDRPAKTAALRGPKPVKIGLKCLTIQRQNYCKFSVLNDAYDL